MKRKTSGVLLFAGIVSLVMFGIIVISGFIKKRPFALFLGEDRKVLGEMSDIKYDFLSGAFTQTQEVLLQKTNELKKSILATMQQEIGNLTSSQIKHLQTQICTDWGVIPISIQPIKQP